MIKPPCKDKNGADCPNRAVGCQGTCERYLTFRAKRDEELEKTRMSRLGAVYAADNAFHHRKYYKHASKAQRRLMGQR